MRAAVHTRYGPPEVVRVSEVDTPTPGEHEVLVKVHASTVNRTDCGFRAGKPFIVRFFAGLLKPKATIQGTEFAGTVEEIGSGVTAFRVGDDVFGFSERRFGAHAEYLTMADDGPLAAIPAGFSYDEAAPSTEGAHYALSYINRTKVVAGQHVLVNGASGGIGSAAVQLLKERGAIVTAVCGTDTVELVRGLGADRVIDYQTEDFTKDHQVYDVVLDAVGKSSFERCKRLLKPGGIYTSSELGPLSQNPILALITPLFRGKKVLFPIPPDHDQEGTNYIGKLMESGRFKPVIDRRFPLDQIVEAYRYVETGQKIGNVVITMGPAG